MTRAPLLTHKYPERGNAEADVRAQQLDRRPEDHGVQRFLPVFVDVRGRGGDGGEGGVGVAVEDDEAEDGREDGERAEGVDGEEAVVLAGGEFKRANYAEWDRGDY